MQSGFRPAGAAGLFEHTGQMGSNGFHADVQQLGDILVGEASGNKAEDFHFSISEIVWILCVLRGFL